MEQASRAQATGQPVRRRRVFFLAGFDPRGPAHYHAVYRDEAARQSQTQAGAEGTVYAVGASQPDGEHCVRWTVRSRAAGASVDTVYSYLCWDDIALDNVPRGLLAWLRAVFQFWSRHLLQGGHAASWRLARRWAWALLSIPIFLIGVLAAVAVVAGLAYGTASYSPASAGWRWAAAALCGGVVAWWGWRLALRWNQVWLTHALNGSYAWAAGQLPALDQRLPGFARRIYEALQAADEDAVDEILVVGHCMGAMVGAVVIGQVAQLCADNGRSLGRLRYLTLASPMANYALLRDDVQVAPALRRLAGLDIAWLDYTAPQDPLCCFLVDAIGAVGVPCARRRVRFRMRSARFDKMVDPAMLQQVRRDPLRLHFLYLLATHRPVENDFFALTAGPRSIDDRVAEPTPGAA